MNETQLTFLSVLVPHVTVAAVTVGLLLRELWRANRRAPDVVARLDAVRDDILAELRARTDAAIARLTPPPQEARHTELNSTPTFTYEPVPLEAPQDAGVPSIAMKQVPDRPRVAGDQPVSVRARGPFEAPGQAPKPKAP